MNKLKFFSIMLLGVAMLYSCDKEATLTISTQEILLDGTGVDATNSAAVFEVNSSADWTLRYYSWLSPSVTSGESGVTEVFVTATSTDVERVGYISAVNNRNNDLNVLITVRQVPEEFVASTLTVTPMPVLVDFEGKIQAGTLPTITISTNKKWTISNLPDWVTADRVSGSAGTEVVTLTVEINEQLEREDSFTIQAGTCTETVTIVQAADPWPIISTMFIKVNAEGKTQEGTSPKITISHNKDWAITGLPDWVTVDRASGSAGTDIDITLTVDNNNDFWPRADQFLFNARIIKIHQSGKGVDEELNVTADKKYLMLPPDDWFPWQGAAYPYVHYNWEPGKYTAREIGVRQDLQWVSENAIILKTNPQELPLKFDDEYTYHLDFEWKIEGTGTVTVGVHNQAFMAGTPALKWGGSFGGSSTGNASMSVNHLDVDDVAHLTNLIFIFYAPTTVTGFEISNFIIKRE